MRYCGPGIVPPPTTSLQLPALPLLSCPYPCPCPPLVPSSSIELPDNFFLTPHFARLKSLSSSSPSRRLVLARAYAEPLLRTHRPTMAMNAATRRATAAYARIMGVGWAPRRRPRPPERTRSVKARDARGVWSFGARVGRRDFRGGEGRIARRTRGRRDMKARSWWGEVYDLDCVSSATLPGARNHAGRKDS